jgi:hypothetical protein
MELDIPMVLTALEKKAACPHRGQWLPAVAGEEGYPLSLEIEEGYPSSLEIEEGYPLPPGKNLADLRQERTMPATAWELWRYANLVSSRKGIWPRKRNWATDMYRSYVFGTPYKMY